MEYMTIVCVCYNDGTETKKSIYTVETPDLAVKGVYTYMGQYMTVSNVASVMAIAANSIGGIYKNEHWTAPVAHENEEQT